MLRFAQIGYLGYNEAPPPLLWAVGRSGERITWTPPEPGARWSRWSSDAESLGQSVEIGSEPHVSPSGRADLHRRRYLRELRWTVDHGGPYVFQFVNRSSLRAEVLDLSLELRTERGCGCAQGGEGSRGWAVVLLLWGLCRRARDVLGAVGNS